MELKIVVLLLVLAILIRRCNAKSMENDEKIGNDQNQPGVRLAIREINALAINICIVSDNCNNAAFNNYCCPENICCTVFSYIAQSK